MILFVLFFLILFLYAIFSYILTEPNLILSSHPLYWNFQLWMWDRFYHNAEFITATYIFIIISLFFIYGWLVYILSKKQIIFKLSFESMHTWAYGVLIVPLLVSYNALSHDIFNYIFNAKMVLVYGYNPHIKTALDFAQIDDWVRFMHNIHTTAPYGYGWTAISLIPSFLGMEKLLPTLLFFKLFMVLGVIFLYFALQHLSKTVFKRSLYVHELAIIFLNPLFLIEVFSNYHNDVWMMAPAVLGVSILLRLIESAVGKQFDKKTFLYFIVSCILLSFSVSIKLVTVVLVPFFFIGFLILFLLPYYSSLIKARFNLPIPTQFISAGLLFFTRFINQYIPTGVAILLFLPLLTQRSQQFLPWYLVWILVWIPFIQSRAIKNTILILSLSAMLRYVPWLYNGFEYSAEITSQQKLITWIIPVVYLFTNIQDTIRGNRGTKKLGKT